MENQERVLGPTRCASDLILDWHLASKRVTTRARGVIPGCRPAGKDGHMAVDKHGRPWIEVAKAWHQAREVAE